MTVIDIPAAGKFLSALTRPRKLLFQYFNGTLTRWLGNLLYTQLLLPSYGGLPASQGSFIFSAFSSPLCNAAKSSPLGFTRLARPSSGISLQLYAIYIARRSHACVCRARERECAGGWIFRIIRLRKLNRRRRASGRRWKGQARKLRASFPPNSRRDRSSY